MQTIFFAAHETLKETGFYEGAFHGASVEALDELLNSQIMQRVLDRIIEKVNRQSSLARNMNLSRQRASLAMKIILRVVLMKQKQSKTSSFTGTIDELFLNPINTRASQNINEQISSALSISPDTSRSFIELFCTVSHDALILDKPLYTMGYGTGINTVRFSRSVVEDTLNYDLEDEGFCERSMNVLTCGLWSTLFGRANPRLARRENQISDRPHNTPAINFRPHSD